MNSKASFFLIAFLFSFSFSANYAERAVLVHNTLEDIEACKGKLKLRLMRIWGGETEVDENKFFKTPSDIAIDSNSRVYICDRHSHSIKIFNQAGKYLHTIGRKGRGPGDVFGPNCIAISPGFDLWVCESSGRRLQRFGPSGKSKEIIKLKSMPRWLGVTSKDELALYSRHDTFESRKLISIIDTEGKPIRKIGQYHDKSNNELTSEGLKFTIADNDCIYAANLFTPVIRKYFPGGRMVMAVTFDTPFEIPPVKIQLNIQGDEIERIEPKGNKGEPEVTGKSGGVVIQRAKGKGRPKVVIFSGLGTDSQERIYIVTVDRHLTEREKKAAVVIMDSNSIDRRKMDFDVIKGIDIFKLLVFSPKGRIIAEAPVKTICDDIYIAGNRLFIVDGFYNQRVVEYEMSFQEEGQEKKHGQSQQTVH